MNYTPFLSLTAEEYRRQQGIKDPPKAKPSKVLARGRTQPKRDGSMNKTEARYAGELERRRQAGEIVRWDFQPEKLRLADRTFYEPDFRVVMPDGLIAWHEVKGHWEDDARVKIKVAAELHPYRFIAVHEEGRGRWRMEEI